WHHRRRLGGGRTDRRDPRAAHGRGCRLPQVGGAAVVAMSTPPDDVAARVGDLLGMRVSDAHRLSGGASRETWSVDAVGDDGAVVPLIVRRDPRGIARAPETALLRSAAAAGVPVPAIVAEDDEHVVVARIAGETIPRKILRDEEF